MTPLCATRRSATRRISARRNAPHLNATRLSIALAQLLSVAAFVVIVSALSYQLIGG